MEKIAEMGHVAILPSPGMGHLIPLVELAKRLVHEHGLGVTFLVPSSGPPSPAMSSVLSALPPAIRHLFLPPVTLSDLPSDARAETVISLTVMRSLPSLRDSLRHLSASTRLVSLVSDLFGTDTFDIARELSLSPFIFFPSTAMALSLFLCLPELDRQVAAGCEFREMPDPVQIPGCMPIRGEDLLDPVQDRANEAYKWVLHHTKRYTLPDGIMVNSFPELEPGAVKSLQETRPGKPPVYPVGPLVNVDTSGPGDGSDQCLKWLDAQPHGSVLFVSFGSGGTLSSQQVKELANGLELSEQKFLWVVRAPNDKSANATFFSVNTNSDRFDFLPLGFLERTKGRGLVVPSWAPQAQVLAHKSTGGFLTHCGWNSTLESVANGVPLIVWPLYAEQKMNAIMLTEDIRVALRPKVGENGVVGREEVAKVVKGLMEGEQGKKLRNRMKELKESAAQVLSKDGSSTKALSQVVLKWKTNH